MTAGIQLHFTSLFKNHEFHSFHDDSLNREVSEIRGFTGEKILTELSHPLITTTDDTDDTDF